MYNVIHSKDDSNNLLSSQENKEGEILPWQQQDWPEEAEEAGPTLYCAMLHSMR